MAISAMQWSTGYEGCDRQCNVLYLVFLLLTCAALFGYTYGGGFKFFTPDSKFYYACWISSDRFQVLLVSTGMIQHCNKQCISCFVECIKKNG